MKSLAGKAYFKSIYSKLDVSNEMPYDKWIINLSIRGTWQDQTTAVFLSLLFQINICIISNTLDGFQIVNMRKWLKMLWVTTYICPLKLDRTRIVVRLTAAEHAREQLRNAHK